MKIGTFSVRELFTYLDFTSWKNVAAAVGASEAELENYVHNVIAKKDLIVHDSVLGRVPGSPYKTTPLRKESLVTMTVKFPWAGMLHFLQFEVECKGFRQFTCRFVRKKV